MQKGLVDVIKLLLITGVSSVLTCCTVGPNYKSPAPPATHRYTSSHLSKTTTKIPGKAQANRTQRFIKGSDIPGKWWALFHSRQLNQLVQEGIDNSPNLAAANAALVEAYDTARAQVGEAYYPSIGLELAAQRAQISGLPFGFLGSNRFSLYSANLKANYILDIFGKQRRLVEGYLAQVDYYRYELLATYLTLTSNIATTYINIASLQAQIQVTKQLITTQFSVLRIVKKQLGVGGASEEDVITQESLLAQTEATLPPLIKNVKAQQDMLAILVGKLPSEYQPAKYRLSSLVLPKKLPVSLPSLLVEQRPDIQASSALLHEASAQIGVAIGNLLPQISLAGSLGWISRKITNLFNPANMIWNYGISLLQTVFRGGALFAAKDAAIATYKQALAQYQQTVLNAFKEVADALTAIQFDAIALKAQYMAQLAAKRTLNITTKQFKVGGNNYLNVLNAQEQYLKAKLNYVQAQTARYLDTVTLFQVLGGGWWHQPINLQSWVAAGHKKSPPPIPIVILPAPGTKNYNKTRYQGVTA